MITITQEELNKPIKEIATWYKQNLVGAIVKHPMIGDIHIYNSSFGETRHHVAKKFLCILYHLEELLKTSHTNGKIGKDRKQHIQNCQGFIYLYNKVNVHNEILNIRLNILVDNMGQKYYMFNFLKNGNTILDPKMFPNENFSEGSNDTSNNIIQQKDKNVKGQDVKIGDTFMLGDCIQITVVDILPNIKGLNEEFRKILGD